MSSDVVINVENLSKCYHIYDNPQDRLKQFVLPRVQRIAGMDRQSYFREFWALKDINFQVAKGEAVGIVGRNGSGKSTLLQIITGTLNPTSGTIQTIGRIAALLELGSGFSPEFSGRENVYLNGALLGLSTREISEKFDDIAAFADIGPHLDQPVKTYSSGMLVRLAFALQVQVEPDILIIDEALAVGDWLFQKRCFQRLEKLTSQGTTLLFVSHDQESVRTLTTRALLLHQGRQVTWGGSSDVVRDYRRLLHDEETEYLRLMVEKKSMDANLKIGLEAATTSPSPAQTEMIEDNLSFGNGEAVISKVTILDKNGEKGTVFYPGDEVLIRIDCKILRPLKNLNVALQIRNKEHLKIYSWGTLNQDMSNIASSADADIFWHKTFQAGDEISVDLIFDCTLGVNFYEVQAAISQETTPDYRSQRVLHWRDEAAFFQVSQRRDEYFFGGICDLSMSARW